MDVESGHVLYHPACLLQQFVDVCPSLFFRSHAIPVLSFPSYLLTLDHYIPHLLLKGLAHQPHDVWQPLLMI